MSAKAISVMSAIGTASAAPAVVQIASMKSRSKGNGAVMGVQPPRRVKGMRCGDVPT
jgi:hypothetical protein